MRGSVAEASVVAECAGLCGAAHGSDSRLPMATVARVPLGSRSGTSAAPPPRLCASKAASTPSSTSSNTNPTHSWTCSASLQSSGAEGVLLVLVAACGGALRRRARQHAEKCGPRVIAEGQ